MKIPRSVLVSTSLLLILSACAAQDSSANNEPELTAETVAPGPTVNANDREPASTEASEQAPAERVGGEDAVLMSQDAVRDDYSARKELPLSSIRVVIQEEVTWPNGAIGCPESGMSYTQALVPGSRIVVTDGTEEGAYHAGPSGEYTFCATPTAPAASNPDA